MSSRSQQQTAAVLADKKRQRREARIREHYDRISAALTNTDSTKFAARYPTRVIPDVPGIMELSATEVKRDLKEADHHSEFRYYPPMDDEDTLLQAMATVAHPPALEGSHIITKMQRLLSWQNNPEIRAQDLDLWQKKMLEASSNYHRFEEEQEDWYDAFEASRKLFTSMLSVAQAQSQILLEDSQHFYRLCEEECFKGMNHSNSVEDTEDAAAEEAGNNTDNGSHQKAHGGKKMKVTIRDMVDELARRQLEYVHGANMPDDSTTKGNASQQQGQKKNVTVVEVTDEAMEIARKASSLGDKVVAIGAGHTVSSSPAAIGVNPITSSTKHGAIRMVVKKEAQELIQHADEMDLGDADNVYHDARNLQILMQQLKESVERSDMQQSDVDIFFQEREDNLSFLEHALLQHATGIPMEKRQMSSGNGAVSSAAITAENKALAEKAFNDLLHQPTRQWEMFLSETLDAMEPSGLVTRKKKRNMDNIALNVFVRHRTERGRMLMYTPLSKLEDRYLACFPGTLPSIYTTRRTGIRPDEIVNTRAQYVPPAIAQAEDDALERAYLQSDAAALNLHIKQLKQSIADLQRMQQESDIALQRAQMAQRHVTLEDHAEYVQSMVTLAEQKLIPQETLASLSTPETAAALAHYEALQQNAGINALLGVGGFGAGIGVAGGIAGGGAGLGVIGGNAKSGNKGGKQKKGGFGGQRQGSAGTATVSAASTFSALAALTAVTETAMLSTGTSATTNNLGVMGPSLTSDALSTAVSTSSALDIIEDNTNNVSVVEPVINGNKTQPISRRNSRGVGINAQGNNGSSSNLTEQSASPPMVEPTDPVSAISTVTARGNKGGRKSAVSSSTAPSTAATTSDTKDAEPVAAVASIAAPAPAASGSGRGGKGGRRSSMPPSEEDTSASTSTDVPHTTTGNNSNNNNKRKSEALAAASENNGASSENNETVAVPPAAKRQRVSKK